MTETRAAGATGENPEGGAPPEETKPSVKDTKTLRAKIKTAGERIANLKSDRTAINADIQAELESLVPQGIPKDSLKRAIKDAELDPEKLDAQDVAYVIARAALGKPIQSELFPATGAVKH